MIYNTASAPSSSLANMQLSLCNLVAATRRAASSSSNVALVNSASVLSHRNEALPETILMEKVEIKKPLATRFPLQHLPQPHSQPKQQKAIASSKAVKAVAKGPKPLYKKNKTSIDKKKLLKAVTSSCDWSVVTVAREQQQQRAKKARKTVRFAPPTSAAQASKLVLTPETIPDLWYQPQDYGRMDDDARLSLQALKSMKMNLTRLAHDDQYCVRGLEMKLSPDIHHLRRLRASMTVRAVLLAQKQQQQQQGTATNVQDKDVMLATVSQQYTQQARLRARELGLIDSIESRRLS